MKNYKIIWLKYYSYIRNVFRVSIKINNRIFSTFITQITKLRIIYNKL